MREAGSGHLIAVTSLAGVVGQPFQDAYCAAKFAVEGAEETGEFIAAVADEEHPALRYQTGGLVRAIAGMKLKDLDGQTISTFMAGWLADPDA